MYGVVHVNVGISVVKIGVWDGVCGSRMRSVISGGSGVIVVDGRRYGEGGGGGIKNGMKGGEVGGVEGRKVGLGGVAMVVDGSVCFVFVARRGEDK